MVIFHSYVQLPEGKPRDQISGVRKEDGKTHPPQIRATKTRVSKEVYRWCSSGCILSSGWFSMCWTPMFDIFFFKSISDQPPIDVS